MLFGRKKPVVDFLIAGVQKGGTSSLDAWLRQHPQVRMARKKEVHYFDFDHRWRKDRWYHRYFDRRPQHRAVGEATPIYTYAPAAARRIHEYNPAMRLIVLLRHPVARAWSQWRMESAAGRETAGFGEAIRRHAEPTYHRVRSYVHRGFYSEQIRRLRQFFADQQLLFIKSESLFRDPGSAMAEICRFLGIEACRFDTSRVHRVGQDRGDIPTADRAFLLETYRDEVSQVEHLLGWNCDDWRI